MPGRPARARHSPRLRARPPPPGRRRAPWPRSRPARPRRSAMDRSRRSRPLEAVAQPEEAPAEVRLDRAQRPARQRGYLLERALAEEAQRDDLAVRFIEAGEGATGRSRTLGAECRLLWLRARGCRDRGHGIALERSHRADPADRLAPARLTDREPHCDARQPRAERTIAAPRRERAIRAHERLLGDVLGLVHVAE